jgi:nitrile hydratase
LDGIHDLGGMSGFGAVEVEPDEPRFHEPWEATAFCLNALGIGVLGAYNADEYRHAVERMEPSHYLGASYYERMLTAVASLLVEKGLVDPGDLEERAGGAFPLARPAAIVEGDGVVGTDSARFSVGDQVVVRDIHPIGHTRVPRFVRGRPGVVLHVAPSFPFPDASAHGLPTRSEHTYHVKFEARALWTDAAGSHESVIVDLWESYLEERQ